MEIWNAFQRDNLFLSADELITMNTLCLSPGCLANQSCLELDRKIELRIQTALGEELRPPRPTFCAGLVPYTLCPQESQQLEVRKCLGKIWNLRGLLLQSVVKLPRLTALPRGKCLTHAFTWKNSPGVYYHMHFTLSFLEVVNSSNNILLPSDQSIYIKVMDWSSMKG